MLDLLLLLVQFFLLPTSTAQVNASTFYLSGLFPLEAEDVRTRLDLGIYTRAAAEMAVQHINQMNFSFKMELISLNSGCEEATCVYGLTEMLEFLKQKFNDACEERQHQCTSGGSFIDAIPTLPHAILGPACNRPAVLTASLTGTNLNSIQMSYAADTPQLTDVQNYPLLFQSVPSYSTYQAVIYAVMREFDWLHVGIIHDVVPYYTIALEQFVKLLQQGTNGARVIASQGFDSHLLLAESLNARIFIGMVSEADAVSLLCAAYHLGTTGPSYQWILLGNFEEGWWEKIGNSKRKLNKRSCTRDQMLQAVESAFILTHDFQIMQQDVVKTISGRSVKEFWNEYTEHFNTSTAARGTQMEFERDRAFRVPSTYDAVWSIALALNETMSSNISHSRPFNDTPLSFVLKKKLETLNFRGVSGKIRFSPQSHSQLPLPTIIRQMQSGIMVSIGVHDPDTDTVNLSYFDNELVWQDTHPPRDRPQVHVESVNIWLVGIILVFTIIGLLFTLAIFIVNFIYRKHKVIKASSPYINMIIIAGCVLGFCSIIVMSIESIDTNRNISPLGYSFLCNIRPWLLSCGFTLAFGALFAKTWRVYMIFRNPWRKNRPYKDRVLIAIVCVLLLFDIVLLVLWAILDPLMLILMTVDRDEVNFIQEQHAVCTLSNGLTTRFVIWMSIISLPKGVLLLFGTFLVTQASKIKTKIFNDARYTAIAIYGVVIACLTGMPTTLLSMYKFEEEYGYADATTIILFCCYLILVMVFVPKLVLLKRYKTKVPTAVLLNINPSFRIHKQRMRKSHTLVPQNYCTSNETHSNVEEDESGIALNNSSTADLCDTVHATDEDSVDITTQYEWEEAREDSLDNEQMFESHGEEIVKYGDISYIAYVSYRIEESFHENSISSTI